MPGRTISNRFYYVYVLHSMKDNKQYIGYTSNLRKRMEQHQQGKSFATAPRRPFELTYYEACRSLVDAKRREEYFKGTGGRRYLAKRLKDYYGQNNSKLY
ncbi:MAG: GIY-YIG nuclease family protein [bacterium]|nr:GIY-YIG nuclease family protein [bacterium]